MIRTWHGWVESKNVKDKRQRNRLRRLPPCIPRTARADYSWIFWDPTGELQRKFNQEREKSFVRYLPNWMRSSPFGSAEPDTNNDCDIEVSRPREVMAIDGALNGGNVGTLALLGRRWHRRWRRERTWTSSSDTYIDDSDHDLERQSVYHTAGDQDAFNDSVTTVRIRRPKEHANSDRLIGSEVIERAMTTQLITPTAANNLLRLFREPPIRTTRRAPSVDLGHGPRTENSPSGVAILPPPHRLPDSQYNTGIYPTTQDRHRNPTTTSHECYVIRSHCPPRRLSTWTYGLDNSRTHFTPTVAVNESCSRPHSTSASASLIDIDAEGIGRFSFEEPTIYIPRRRGGTRSTLDSTADAERMSIINLPFDGDEKISEVDPEVDKSFDAQAYEQAKELDDFGTTSDADGLSSVSSSRVGSRL